MMPLAQTPPITDRPLGAPRRGAVLVMAIWVILILAALALVFARAMRVELTAAGNRVAAEQAAAVARAAEQYALAVVGGADGDAVDVMAAPAEAVAVGEGGYFWILRPSLGSSGGGDARSYEFGIVDEAAKLNLNAADALDLADLPGVGNDLAFAITDWRDEDTELSTGGAESSYYLALQQPYKCKNAPIESVEELRLLRGVTDDLLYGYDRNQNGVADDARLPGRDTLTGGDSTADERGLAPFVTASTVERNTDRKGRPRVNIGDGQRTLTIPDGGQPVPPGGGPPGGGGAPGRIGSRMPRGASQVAAPAPVPGGPGGPGGPGQPGSPPGQPGPAPNEAELREALKDSMQPQRVEEVLARARGGRPFRNVFDFAVKAGLTQDELRGVFDRLTTAEGKVIVGRVNVNTAPRQVLACLPGLEPADADTLIARRASAEPGDAAWVLDALTPEKIADCGGMITGQSFQYSADIVAASRDGRAFRRVRVVIDARATPPVIVRRKDVTSLGWPLAEGIREQLRSGQQPQAATSSRGFRRG